MIGDIDRWMECLGEDVNRMVCGVWCWIGLGWSDGGWRMEVMLSCDWAIVCGVCYYRELLQMQHFHPEPRPQLVMANSADNTC